MKTFEEALTAAVGVTGNEDMSLRIHDARDLADEIVSSSEAKRYLLNLVSVAEREAASESAGDDIPSEKEFLSFLMSLAFSVFVVGVRVGIEMEKQEIGEAVRG